MSHFIWHITILRQIEESKSAIMIVFRESQQQKTTRRWFSILL